MDISAGSAGFASSDLQHGRVGVHRKNLAFRLASLERDRQGARAATDIDDPIARLRCDKLQQVASPPFLAGHERDCGVIAVERTALAKRGYEISVGVGHDPSLTAALASALERRGYPSLMRSLAHMPNIALIVRAKWALSLNPAMCAASVASSEGRRVGKECVSTVRAR